MRHAVAQNIINSSNIIKTMIMMHRSPVEYDYVNSFVKMVHIYKPDLNTSQYF